jgi:hypothetical protein
LVLRRLPQAALRRADEQLFPERFEREALRDFPVGRRSFRRRGHLGKLAQITETWERTFAVITVPANELVAPIHDRMLAILQNDQFSRWLSEEADPRDLLVPFPEHQLAIKPQPSRR